MKISLEWYKMASNATFSHLKTRIFPGGACPQTPLVSYVYIPLHSIYISACTSIITALHVFYRCLGYHIIHVPDPLLYFVSTPPPPPPHHPTIYIQYMHQIYMHILRAVIHCNTQASPPKILFLDRTLSMVVRCYHAP